MGTVNVVEITKLRDILRQRDKVLAILNQKYTEAIQKGREAIEQLSDELKTLDPNIPGKLKNWDVRCKNLMDECDEANEDCHREIASEEDYFRFVYECLSDALIDLKLAVKRNEHETPR